MRKLSVLAACAAVLLYPMAAQSQGADEERDIGPWHFVKSTDAMTGGVIASVAAKSADGSGELIYLCSRQHPRGMIAIHTKEFLGDSLRPLMNHMTHLRHIMFKIQLQPAVLQSWTFDGHLGSDDSNHDVLEVRNLIAASGGTMSYRALTFDDDPVDVTVDTHQWDEARAAVEPYCW